MNHAWKTGLIVAAMSIILAAAAACSKEEGPPGKPQLSWHRSLAGAKLEARRRHSLILVDFHGNRSGWRAETEKETLADPGLQARLKEFTLLRLNASERRDPGDRFGVESFPTRMVLNEKGHVITSRPGHMVPEEYLEFLKKAARQALEPPAAVALPQAETTRPAGGKPGLSWHRSLPDALAEAKKRHTLIVTDIYGDGCRWCAKLEKETLANPEVQARLKDFTLFKLHANKHPDLARRFLVRGYPTTLVLSEEGNVIAGKAGYVPPKKYLDFLERAAKQAQKTVPKDAPKNSAKGAPSDAPKQAPEPPAE